VRALIKGNVNQAVQAAGARTLVVLAAKQGTTVGPYTWLNLDEADLQTVVRWFCEEKPGESYPNGTCLFYDFQPWD
jgi:hypothetical protein